MGSMNDLLFKFNAPPNVNLPIFLPGYVPGINAGPRRFA